MRAIRKPRNTPLTSLLSLMHDTQLTAVPTRWRTLAAVALFWLTTIGILIGFGMVSHIAPARFSALAWGATSSIGLLALTAAFLHWERRDASSAGLRFELRSIGRFGIGAAIGGALYGAYLLILLNLTDVRIVSAPVIPIATLLLALATYLTLAIMEEIGFRGYALRRLEERMGRASALVLGAFVFGALHLAYGWTIGAAMLGAGAGALLFGIAALVSRGLAVPIGVHTAWNLAVWSVGEKDGAGLWHLVIPEPAAHAVTVGSFSYMLVMALGFIGFWQFGRVRERLGGGT